MEPINVIGKDNGTPIVTFEQQRDIGTQFIRDKSGRGLDVMDLGLRKTNPDGSIARSWYTSKAVNTGWFFDNRYRMVGKKLQVVSAQTSEGYRAITDLRKGRIFSKQLTAYEFERKGDKIVFNSAVLVSDQDFITHFTNKLDEEAMKVILPLIPSGTPSVPEVKLPI